MIPSASAERRPSVPWLGFALAWFPLAAYGALLWVAAPPWPDDWDGVGFLEAVNDFDLVRFRPHPPGYPVYVALLRVAAAFVRTPMRACIVVAVASASAAIVVSWDAMRRALGDRAAWQAATFIAVAPGVWHVCSGIGSESPALACAAACAWGLLGQARAGKTAATVLGIGAGIGLGVRLSWSPLYLAALAFASRGSRARAWGAAGLACVFWLVPFVALVGPRALVAAYATHFGGHALRWGGTIVTEPGAIRALWLARDLFVDGLGVDADPLGVAIGTLIAIGLAQAAFVWHSFRWRGWRAVLGIAVPYLLWIGLGQNLRDQPRHAVPIVALFAAALAIACARRRAASLAAWLLVLLVAIRTAADARARRTIAPPGEQLVQLARAQPSPKRLVVFGGASVRFFETADIAASAFIAGSLGEAAMALTRLDELPTRVWVTSEVAGLEDSRSPLESIAMLCRPPRLDRRMPCLRVYEMKLPFLPAPWR